MCLTVGIIDRIAGLDLSVTVIAVEQAFSRVAFFVTLLVLEQFPATQR